MMRRAVAPFLLGAALLAAAPDVPAHGGEDHEHAAPAPAAATDGPVRKFESTSPTVEALLEIPAASAREPRLLRLFLSDFATSEPIAGATVSLSIPDLQLDLALAASPRLPGLYEITATPGLPGDHSAMLRIDSTTHPDLLVFDALRFGPEPGTESVAWWRAPRTIVGGIVLLALLSSAAFLLLGRAPRQGRVAALAIAFLSTSALRVRAHGGEDHGAPATTAASAGTVAVVSKEAQFLLGLRTIVATPETLQGRTRLGGVVLAPPDASAEIIAPQAGRLLPVDGALPRVGDRVTSGQALVVLEGALAPQDRVSGASDLAEAQSHAVAAARELDLAERDLARMEAIPEVVSQRDLEAGGARVASARAALQAANARVAILRSSLGGGPGSAARLVVTSPIDGVVTEAHVALGETAEGGHRLFRVIDPARLIVRADVPERDAGSLRFEAAARAKVVSRVAEGLAADATYLSMSQAIDPITRSIPVFFGLLPDARLLDGMLVDVLVETGAPVAGFVVPVSALTNLGAGRDVVFVKTSAEQFVPRDVTLGITDGDSVEILSGLRAGDRVVVSGAPRVRAALVAPSG